MDELKALQNDISIGGNKEGDVGERRGVHAFMLHVLNHTALLKPLLPRQRNEQQDFKETARARGRGGKSPHV